MPNPVSSGVQPIQGPQYSGFDKSHKNLLTGKVGTLIPVLCDPVIPGTRVSLKDAMRLAMPPLASDTFMNLKLKKEAFFVPASACYGGFNDFVTKRNIIDLSGTDKKAILPYIDLEFLPSLYDTRSGNSLNLSFVDEFAPGMLADYLDMKGFTQMPSDLDLLPKVNPLPFIAYHRIYDRFYRNSLITRPLFSRCSKPHNLRWADSSGNNYKGYSVENLPYITFVEGEETSARIQYGPDGWDPQTLRPTTFTGVDNVFATLLGQSLDTAYAAGEVADDHMGLFHLHQRNFGADYFTTATPTPQKGPEATIEFTVDAQGDGEISISAIRAMNAMKLFRERNNYVDDNIHAYNRAHYNVNKTGYGESLPQYLGQEVTDIYTDGVNQTSEYSTGNSQNPFGSVGAQYGQASAAGQGSLIDSFEAPEFGYIIVLASLVPEATYSTGINRHMFELVNGNGVSDIPDALLQNVGPQEVYNFELCANAIAGVSPSSPNAWKAAFGYQQRYAHYMEKRDTVHGLFRDGESLEAFSLQRSFPTNAALSTAFLRIPTNFLDQVAAVSGQISQYGFWMDIFFNYKVSMPLAAYSIPSLENPDGPIEFVPKPGYTIR